MRKVQIITDSTSDLVLDDREKYNIEYLKMGFNINNTEYEANLDWNQISPQEYYSLIKKGNRATTSLIKTEEIENKFKKALDNNLDVLYLAVSSKLSGSINYASILSLDMLSNYPDRKIVCYDTLRSTYAEGMIAIDCAKMANEGASLEEIINYLDNNKLKYQTYATVGSLEWLKLAGRVKASNAFFGNLLGVKPIILGDAIGNNNAIKKIRGRKASLLELVSLCKEQIIDPENQIIYLEHADSIEDANFLKDELIKTINPKEVRVSMLGPIIGATTGPDTVMISFYGKEVTITSE